MSNRDKYIDRCTSPLKIVFLIALSMLSSTAYCVQDWPAERWQDALKLGGLAGSFSNGDVSGAHWNSKTQTLWLSDNKEEMIWSLIETDGDFKMDKSFLASGDIEGITQGLDNSVVYVMDEEGYIRAYHAESGNALTTWKIKNALPSNGKKGNSGPEGITFVPDRWLQQSGFVDDKGHMYAASKYELGGIFLVAHQNGGALYAFDLAKQGSFNFIGQYDTAREESSALAFDRSTGVLYISHNVDGNTLETTDLQSKKSAGHRKFISKSEFAAPNGSNLEGFTLKPAFNADATANKVWAFYTDDDGNTSKGNAILVFKKFNPIFPVKGINN